MSPAPAQVGLLLTKPRRSRCKLAASTQRLTRQSLRSNRPAPKSTGGGVLCSAGARARLGCLSRLWLGSIGVAECWPRGGGLDHSPAGSAGPSTHQMPTATTGFAVLTGGAVGRTGCWANAGWSRLLAGSAKRVWCVLCRQARAAGELSLAGTLGRAIPLTLGVSGCDERIGETAEHRDLGPH